MTTVFIGLVLTPEDVNSLDVDLSEYYFIGIKRVHKYDKMIYAIECEVESHKDKCLGLGENIYIGGGINKNYLCEEILINPRFGPRILKTYPTTYNSNTTLPALYKNLEEMSTDVFDDY